jgi:hypothetical protein
MVMLVFWVVVKVREFLALTVVIQTATLSVVQLVLQINSLIMLAQRLSWHAP